jgi:hypothetical protein
MKKFLTLLGISIFLNSCTKDLGGGEPPINVPSSTTLTGSINSTITLTSDKVWTLKGYVYVTDGAKLIIQPGTTIVSDLTEKGALCIERGAQIIAEGTPSKPIVFTSGKPEGQRNPGDWGGVVILGRSTTNRSSEPTIEGGIGRPYGGTNDSDNSGVLKYVRIEYAGIAALPNSEINALTLGGVGSGTVLENVQTIYANDDAFEFFGGTVNAKNLYAFATADDDFDFDFGYRGSISYSVAKRDPQFVDNGDAGNGVECDNDGTGSSAQPYTHPKLSYMVIVGPNNSLSLSNHNLGLRWRRATQFTITNSVIAGHMKGSFSLESNETATFYKDGISKFENNQIGSFDPLLNFKSTSTLFTASEMKTKFLSQGNIEKTFSNSELQVLTSPSWTQGWTRFPLKGN